MGRKAGHLAAVVSPHLTVEEAYLLCQFIRSIDGEALLVIGPVPVVGEDPSCSGLYCASDTPWVLWLKEWTGAFLSKSHTVAFRPVPATTTRLPSG
jgi:hypothetical protein